jgi:transposase, IS5 family
MVRIHFMRQWYTLSDSATEVALHDMPLFCDFARLGGWNVCLPDEKAILRCRHLLEKYKLGPEALATVNNLLRRNGLMRCVGLVIDATLIASPSSTEKESSERDLQFHHSNNGSRWYFGVKSQIGADAESGLLRTVQGTLCNVNDVVEANVLLHGEETDSICGAGYRGAKKRLDTKPKVHWKVAIRPGKCTALEQTKALEQLMGQLERLKASIRSKVEHPYREIKRQFGHVEVRYRGPKWNAARLTTLFASSNLWMACSKFAVLDGQVRPQMAQAA